MSVTVKEPEAIMQAVKAYGSVGEITNTLVGVFGRYREPIRFDEAFAAELEA